MKDNYVVALMSKNIPETYDYLQNFETIMDI